MRFDSGWWRRFAELGCVYGPEWWKRRSPPVIAAIIVSIARDQRAAVLRNQRQVRGLRGWVRERWDAYRVFAEAARSMTESLVWITSAVKMRLLGDSQTPGLDINVDTWAGVVTLFGIVPSQLAKAAAEADARKVSGVKRVENELQVVASAKQPAGKVRDEELERTVKQAFDTPDLKGISIEVSCG